MKATASGSGGIIALLIVVTAWVLPAQSAHFEVASIHPLAPPFRALRSLKVSGTLITLEGYRISWLVADALGLKDYQLWAESIPRNAQESVYRIEARAPGQSAPAPEELRSMLQALLRDRFHLATHREVRNTPVYALVLDKNGPALKPGSGDAPCQVLIGPVRPEDRNYRYRYTNCTLDRLVDDFDGPADSGQD